MPRFSVARMVEASKRFGLKVEIVPGAETRGSAAFNPYGFVGHHTAGARSGDRPSLNLCVNGRPDLDGPLCNDFLTRAGVNVIVAAGRANHAGAGGFRGLVGNSAVWGCEAEDDGDGTWTGAQWIAYPRLVAARLWMINRDASWYCSHRTWAPTRKIDPTGIADTWMQAQVEPLLRAGGLPAAAQTPAAVKPVNPLPEAAMSAQFVIVTAPNRPWIGYWPATGYARFIGPGEGGVVRRVATAGGSDAVVNVELTEADFTQFQEFLGRTALTNT